MTDKELRTALETRRDQSATGVEILDDDTINTLIVRRHEPVMAGFLRGLLPEANL